MEKIIAYLDTNIFEETFPSIRNQIEPFLGDDTKTVYLFINSGGGHTGEAKNIRSYLYGLREKGIQVITHAQAYCDSAAIIVFGAGQIRKVEKMNESFIVHQPRGGSGFEGFTPEEATAFAERITKIRDEIIQMYKEDFGIDEETALRLIKEENSISTSKLIEYGFATELVDVSLTKNEYLVYNFLERVENVSEEDIKARFREYKQAVNMGYSELSKWGETECSRLASNDRRPLARNLELLNTRIGEWTSKHYDWAGKTLAFISRMKANLGGENIIKDKNGKDCGTKAYISLKNWAYDHQKKVSNNSNKNKNYMEFAYEKVNRKTLNAGESGRLLLENLGLATAKVSVANYLNRLAVEAYAKYLVDNEARPHNMLATTENGVTLFVFTEDETLEGKRAVVANPEGEPTEDPAPDGEHTLSNGSVITVQDSIITGVSSEEASNMEEEEKTENKEEEEKTSNMEEEEKTENKDEEYENKSKEREKNSTGMESEIVKLLKVQTETLQALTKKVEDQGKKIENQQKIIDAANESISEHRISPGGTDEGTQSRFARTTNGVLKQAAAPGERIMKLLETDFMKKQAKITNAINQSRRIENANLITFTGNEYSGKIQLDLLSAALMGANSVQDGHFTVQQGIKDKTRVTRADVPVSFQDNTAAFSAAATDINFNYEKIWTLVEYSVQQRTSFKDLRKAYHAEMIQAGTFNDSVPPQEIMNWYMARIIEKSMIGNEALYWRGKTGANASSGVTMSFTDPYAGIVEQAEADALTRKSKPTSGSIAITSISQATQAVVTVGSTANLNPGDFITITGLTGPQAATVNGLSHQIEEIINGTTFSINVDTTSTGASAGTIVGYYINETNIIPNLKTIVQRIKPAIRSREDFKIFIPEHLKNIYFMAIAEAQKDGGRYFIGTSELDFLANQMLVANYLPSNTIWCNSVSNQILGLDLRSDEETVRVIDEAQFSNNEFISAKIAMKSDIKYVFSDEVTLVSPFS